LTSAIDDTSTDTLSTNHHGRCTDRARGGVVARQRQHHEFHTVRFGDFAAAIVTGDDRDALFGMPMWATRAQRALPDAAKPMKTMRPGNSMWIRRSP